MIVLEHGLIVLATHLTKAQGMKLDPGTLAVVMAQSDSQVQFQPKHLAQNVSETSMDILGMGFQMSTHDSWQGIKKKVNDLE